MATRVEHLDWLRAIAAALVLFGHSANAIAPGGAIGVSVFFVLSGYLITSILLRDGMMSIANIRKFILRRFMRIYPMYVFQIICVVIVIALFRHELLRDAIRALPGLLTFSSDPPGWFGYGFGVLWTLAIEFWFYVTFPFLLAAALPTRRVIACIIVGILISLASKLCDFGGVTMHYYDHFLIGSLCAAAIKFDSIPCFAKAPHMMAAGILLILIIAAIPYPGSRGLLWFCQSLSAATATAIAILAAHASPPKISIPWLAFLGRISYSVYLMHAVLLDILVAVAPSALQSFLWGFVAVTIAVSIVTHYAIEQPFERRVRDRLKYRSAS